VSPNPEEITGFEILEKVGRRAVADPAYREALVKNPKPELIKAGLRIAPNVDVVVHESSPTQLHLVLPSVVCNANQLDPDEVDLEKLHPCIHF
jgi:hypothetical protein